MSIFEEYTRYEMKRQSYRHHLIMEIEKITKDYKLPIRLENLSLRNLEEIKDDLLRGEIIEKM